MLVFVSLVVGFAATPLLRHTMQQVTQGQRAGVPAVACAGGHSNFCTDLLQQAERAPFAWKRRLMCALSTANQLCRRLWVFAFAAHASMC